MQRLCDHKCVGGGEGERQGRAAVAAVAGLPAFEMRGWS